MRYKCIIHIVVNLYTVLRSLPDLAPVGSSSLVSFFSNSPLPQFLSYRFANLLHPPAFQDLYLESLSLVLCWVILQPCLYFLPEAFWPPRPQAQVLGRLREFLGKTLLSFQGWPN